MKAKAPTLASRISGAISFAAVLALAASLTGIPKAPVWLGCSSQRKVIGVTELSAL